MGSISFQVGDQVVTIPAQLEAPVDGVVEVTGNFPNGFEVPAGETWEIKGHVTSNANVVVRGDLRMRPGSWLEFICDNSVTGGDAQAPVANDVGLWMVGRGRLDAKGTPKTGWTRATTGLTAGQTTFQVQSASGWKVGDTIAITATLPRMNPNGGPDRRDDRRTITAINGNSITVNQGLQYAHPARTINGTTYTAEVANLTRDVKITGRSNGRAHVIFLHQGSQQGLQHFGISHVELAHLGFPGESGRYALHFHHAMDTTRGVRVEGVVARDCGGHCFVSHNSHGIYWYDCVTAYTVDTPYWWDFQAASDDITYDKCLAMRSAGDGDKYSNTGFWLNFTVTPMESKCIGCVAAQIEGANDNSGFFWVNDSEGVWTFEDNLAHNISSWQGAGIRVWQNSSPIHPIERTTIYACNIGVRNGAYGNNYQYLGLDIDDCDRGIESQAQPGGQQKWHDVHLTNCGKTLRLHDAPVGSASTGTNFRNCTGLKPIDVVRYHNDSSSSCRWDFIDCGVEPSDFNFTSDSSLGPSRNTPYTLRVQNGTTAWRKTHDTDWTSIAPFA